MTMSAMVDRLVEMGFDVDKVYDKFVKGYRFTISKGDRCTCATFEYPADTSKAYCDQKQREFIDFIVNKWRNDHAQTSSEQQKKLVLVGMKNPEIASEFMSTCIDSLLVEKVSISNIDYARLILETPHMEVRYMCFDRCTNCLDGLNADAIFGREPFITVLRLYLKPGGEEPVKENNIGLVDYICRIERGFAAAQKITDALYDGLGIKKFMVDAHVSEEQYRAYYKHAIDPIMSESRKALAYGEAIQQGLISDLNNDPYKRVSDLCVCDMYPPTLFSNSKEDNMITDEAKSAFMSMVREYAKKHKLQWAFYYPGEMNYLKIRVFYMHRTFSPEKIVMVNWDKVNNIFDLYNTVVCELDAWRNENERYAALMKGENNMAMTDKIYIQRGNAFNRKLPDIKTVHFSGPCTVVIWEDGTKTVVRCNNDVLDPEKGLAMAIAKKALGTNKSGSNYYDIFKKWLPKPEVEKENHGEC